jgi:hypothetical protein
MKPFKWISKKILNPPSYILDIKNNLRALLAQDYREILLTDLIIFFLLAASIRQITFVFSHGAMDVWSVAKAIGIDGAIWLLTRISSKRIFTSLSSKRSRFFQSVFLWTAIIVLLTIATTVNVLYEIWAPNAKVGSIRFFIDSDPLVLFTKMLSSSFLAFMILFLTFVRATLTKNMIDSFSDLKTAEEEEKVRIETEKEKRRELFLERKKKEKKQKEKEERWATVKPSKNNGKVKVGKKK